MKPQTEICMVNGKWDCLDGPCPYSLLPLGGLFREDVCSLLAASLGTQALLSYVPQPLLFQQLVLLSERTVKVTIANTTKQSGLMLIVCPDLVGTR